MVASEFYSLFDKISLTNRVGIEDFGDRLNLFTVVLFGVAVIVVGTKQYIMNSITCYIPVGPSGDLFKEYVNDFCWVRGTIPFRPGERFPTSEATWDEYDKYRRLSEYF
ncbi:Innexin [Paragonimus heterotremus]|uniref:Innexin n=1 Tax=Paragonimus heterotremus TaxID=100268 RepID=A0A8J4WV20_9TREM|nr:Innexin [Paragonimus heterotremus]